MSAPSETAAMQDPASRSTFSRGCASRTSTCDDCGTGASSLTHLYKMPFSEVKLDDQLTNDMRLREDARARRRPRIPPTSSGCATAPKASRTKPRSQCSKRCTVDEVQGHLFGAAVRARELE